MNSIIETASSQSIANLKNDYVDLDNLEEISTFGSHFSKLVSISEKPFDPLPEIDVNNGVRLYVAEALNKYNAISGNTFLNTILPQLTQENQVKLNQLLVGN
jgi:exportin-2 (importin alpha re-exporter)